MRRLSLLLCLTLCAAPAVARAEDAVPLLTGQAAPHAGLLVDEASARACIVQRVELEAARSQVAARDAALAKALPLTERTVGERYGLVIGVSVGVVVGAAAAVAVVYAVKK